MTPIRLLVETAAILAALTVVGLGPWLLLRGRIWRGTGGAWCPLLGLAIVQLTSWLWLSISGERLRPWLTGLLVVSIIGVATLIVLRLFAGGSARLLPDRGITAGMAAAVAGTAIVFMFHFAPVLGLSAYTQPEGGTADVAGYSLLSDSLLDHGIDDVGPIYQGDVGAQARTDVFGAYAYLAFASTALGVDAWQATMAALLVAVLLGAVGLYTMLSRFVRRDHLALGLIVVASLGTFLVMYSVTQYFLSQFLAMAVIPTAFVVLNESARLESRREWLRGVGLLGATCSVLLLTYPHMLFFGMPVVVVAAMLCLVPELTGSSVRTNLCSVARLASAALLAAGLALVVVPGRTVNAIDRVRSLGGAMAGWPLPKVLPIEVLGFQRTFSPERDLVKVTASIAVVGACALAVRVLWRGGRRSVVSLAILAAVLYASYVVVYMHEGVSYTQWKWLAFFAPMIVGPVLVVAMSALEALPLAARVPSRVLLTAMTATLIGLIAIQAVNARTYTEWLDRPKGVPDDLAALASVPRRYDLESVNVSIASPVRPSSVWETTWAAYFLRGVRHEFLLSANLLALAPPCARWTVVRRDDPDRAQMDVLQRRPINRTYELVRLVATSEGAETCPRPRVRRLAADIGARAARIRALPARTAV